MTLLVDTVARERETLLRNGVRLTLLGDIEALPAAPRAGLQALMDETAPLSRMTLHLALSYSGRWEITQAARRIAADVAAGRLAPDAVDEAAVAARMATADAPAPDLLVRTGGETRISNFLLWSLAYTELYFTPCLWPDFRRAQLYEAVKSFQGRERRFGRLHA